MSQSSAEADSTSPLDAFEGAFEPPQVPLRYRLGLFLAALAMIALPLVYVAVTAAAAWGVYLQATQGVVISKSFWGILLYLAPIVAGAVIVFFMIKPLFARPPNPIEAIELDPAEEPLLHEFVHRICDLVGSSTPRVIRVDCQVNASAGFRRGFLSFVGNDLVLTIGLPLAAGMRTDQLAGILAHEFGHFSQGGGMRLTYVVRQINVWFQRVVYERDAWDARLDRWSRELDWRISIMLKLAKAGVWIGRKILYGLMMAGAAVSGFLLRQMEFDADLYEIRLVGAKTYESTAWELPLLNAASGSAHANLNQWWQDGHLVQDLPEFIVAQRRAITEESERSVIAAEESETTGRFDTHPSTTDRVEAARAAGAPGFFHRDAPATELFADFKALSIRVTEWNFREALGLEYDAAHAFDTQQALHETAKSQSSADAFDASTKGLLRLSQAVRAPEPQGLSAVQALEQVRVAQQRLDAQVGELTARLEGFDEAYGRQLMLDRGDALLRSGFRLNAKDFEIPASSHDAMDEALRTAEAARTAGASAAEEARQRIEAVLAAQQELVLAAGDAETVEEWGRLTSALNALAAVGPPLLAMQRDVVGLHSILSNCAGRELNQDERLPLENIASAAVPKIDRILAQLRNVAYPFKHAGGELTMEQFALGDSGSDVLSRGSALLETVPNLYFRVMARLAELGAAAIAAQEADGPVVDY